MATGIYKVTEFAGSDSHGDYVHVLGAGFDKVAAEIFAPVKDFIAKEMVVRPGNTYLHVNAMGAMEAWGNNVNGDAFPEAELVKSHKTFVSHGNPFYFHKNKDPKRSLGKVLFAAYNPEMKRVELVVEIDNEKAPDIVAAVNRGEFPRVSMGTHVPFEICTICGNKNKTLAARCTHLKNQLGIIYPDGRKVQAINTNCVFFDISFVIKPADRTASVIAKVASEGEDKVEPHEVIFDVPTGSPEGVAANLTSPPIGPVLRVLEATEPNLSYSTLKSISAYPLGSLLGSLGALGVILKPLEFQTIIICKSGNQDLARGLYGANTAFDVGEAPIASSKLLGPIDFDESAFRAGFDIAPHRSSFSPFIARRIALVSSGNHDWQIPKPVSSMRHGDMSSMLSSLYSTYRLRLMDKLAELIEMLKVRIASGEARVMSGAIPKMEKSAAIQNPYVKAGLISFPAAYLSAGYMINKRNKGKQLSKVEEMIANHPLHLAAIGTVSPKFLKFAEENAYTKMVDSVIMQDGGPATVGNIMDIKDLDTYIQSKVEGMYDPGGDFFLHIGAK